MTHVDCDVLVIGTGSAGATFAATMAELTDRRVVMVEKGPYFTRSAFNQRELDMNVLIAGRTTDDGAIPVTSGQCVGGGTTVNFALSFDPVKRVWETWRRDRGLAGFSFDRDASDYGVPGLNLASCLDDVRKRINVHTPRDDEINDNNRLFAEGCGRLGISVKRFELNMRDCIGCGYCGQGCAYDRKQGTMITYCADALARGVQLIHHCSIDSLRFEHRGGGRLRAVGASGEIRPTIPGSQPNRLVSGPIDIAAKLVVLCAGSIETPTLLQRSSYPDPYGTVGTGLVLHPSLPIVSIQPREISNYRGITGSYYSDHYAATRGFYYECLFDHPVNASIAVPAFGAMHFEAMLRYRQLSGFGIMLVDDSRPSNRVRWDASRAGPSITYHLAQSDAERLRFAARRGVEIAFATGAKEVFLTSEERIGSLQRPWFTDVSQARECEQLQFRPHETFLVSAHCQATAKMGTSPKNSVVNARGETHHADNLVVCDGSAFPTSCGANPMISVMTLARYQAKRAAAEFSRYL